MINGIFGEPDFACAINCIDGRVQEAVRRFAVKRYRVKWVDMVTEPGPNLILAENTNTAVVERIKERVDISVNHHGSRVIIVAAHPDCGGNPASKDEQIGHLRMARKTVQSFGFNVEIPLLWVESDWMNAILITPHARTTQWAL